MPKRRTNPMPAHATMVFKGKIFEVWQWEQEMFDGSIQVFERLKRPNTVEVLATVRDKLIVQYQEQPDSGEFISLPGGRVDEGEAPEEAIKRELLEETGYSSSDWYLLSKDMPNSKMEWTLYNFVARNCKQTDEPAMDPGEKIRLKLMDFEDVLLLSDDPLFRSTGMRNIFWRARLDPTKKEELRTLLFG